jgi:hypothetical protein
MMDMWFEVTLSAKTYMLGLVVSCFVGVCHSLNSESASMADAWL